MGDDGRELRFGPELRDRLVANLAGHERWEIPVGNRRHAAVAVVVLERERDSGEPAFLLTRRTAGLRAHSAQWALPGGRLDEGEQAVDAARREVREELDLDLPESAVLGALDDYETRSGYVITPFVLWAGDNPIIEPHPDEVLSVHRIPLGELLRPDSPRFITIPESDRPVVQIPIGRTLIHAPTGAVLLQFRRVAIEGTLERVAEYEQPVFAWR